jgi:hypothetical protein
MDALLDVSDDLSGCSVEWIEGHIQRTLATIHGLCGVVHYRLTRFVQASDRVVVHILKTHPPQVMVTEGSATPSFPVRLVLSLSDNSHLTDEVWGVLHSPLQPAQPCNVRLCTLGALLDFLYLHLCVGLTAVRTLLAYSNVMRDALDEADGSSPFTVRQVEAESLLSVPEEGGGRFLLVENKRNHRSLVLTLTPTLQLVPTRLGNTSGNRALLSLPADVPDERATHTEYAVGRRAPQAFSPWRLQRKEEEEAPASSYLWGEAGAPPFTSFEEETRAIEAGVQRVGGDDNVWQYNEHYALVSDLFEEKDGEARLEPKRVSHPVVDTFVKGVLAALEVGVGKSMDELLEQCRVLFTQAAAATTTPFSPHGGNDDSS